MRNLLLAIVISFPVATEICVAQPDGAGGNDFPGVPDIPVPPELSYEGYFDEHSPVKLVFGVSDPGAQLKESLINAAYTIRYLRPRGIPYRIQIVLYARAVLSASVFSEAYGSYAPLLDALNRHGVEFRVCNNSMEALHVQADDLYSYMKVIPAGILQIVKKQMQGYAYISNH